MSVVKLIPEERLEACVAFILAELEEDGVEASLETMRAFAVRYLKTHWAPSIQVDWCRDFLEHVKIYERAKTIAGAGE